jgi:hypothetical protein
MVYFKALRFTPYVLLLTFQIHDKERFNELNIRCSQFGFLLKTSAYQIIPLTFLLTLVNLKKSASMSRKLFGDLFCNV